MHIYEHRVTYDEIDGQKIAFNAHYLKWADRAIYEFYRSGGFPPQKLEQLGFDIVVRKVTVDYLEPSHFDEILQFDLTILHVGSSSCVSLIRIYNDVIEKPIAAIEIVHVNVINQQKTAIPIEIKCFLQTVYDKYKS